MNEPSDIRNKSRRVKNHILTRYLTLADKLDAPENKDKSMKDVFINAEEFMLYRELTDTFSRNVIPRSVEHGGDADNDVPIPILMRSNVSTDNSHSKDSPAQEAN